MNLIHQLKFTNPALQLFQQPILPLLLIFSNLVLQLARSPKYPDLKSWIAFPMLVSPLFPPNLLPPAKLHWAQICGFSHICLFVCLFFSFIFISWRLITLQYCSDFCHTLTWLSHGFTCIPHPDPPSHTPLYPIPLGLPSAPGPNTCLMHPTWAGELFHCR